MDILTETVVRRWRDSNYSKAEMTVYASKAGAYHKSAIDLVGTRLICMEDWDGIEILDYTSDVPSVL